MLAKKTCEDDRVGRRAWKLLRMALIWARKGRLMMELRVVTKFLKSHLAAASTKSRPQIHYFERQLSFDKTPLFNLKMHRPPSMRFNIPCLNPPPVLHDDDDNDDDDDDDLDQDDGHDLEDQGITLSTQDVYGAAAAYEDEAVDRKADEFIAKFYQQIKLQRQISYIQNTVQ